MKLTPMLTLLRDYQLPSNGAMQLPCWGQFRRVVCMSFVLSFYFNGVTVLLLLLFYSEHRSSQSQCKGHIS